MYHSSLVSLDAPIMPELGSTHISRGAEFDRAFFGSCQGVRCAHLCA